MANVQQNGEVLTLQFYNMQALFLMHYVYSHSDFLTTKWQGTNFTVLLDTVSILEAFYSFIHILTLSHSHSGTSCRVGGPASQDSGLSQTTPSGQNMSTGLSVTILRRRMKSQIASLNLSDCFKLHLKSLLYKKL